VSGRAPVRIATRGSALALAQARGVKAACERLFPGIEFELAIIKTTGDRLQTLSLRGPPPALPKGLFTKELEVALLDGSADLAVHSLKDLPTQLPDGLCLGAVLPRADPRDVLVVRRESGAARLEDLPAGAVVATSSTIAEAASVRRMRDRFMPRPLALRRANASCEPVLRPAGRQDPEGTRTSSTRSSRDSRGHPASARSRCPR